MQHNGVTREGESDEGRVFCSICEELLEICCSYNVPTPTSVRGRGDVNLSPRLGVGFRCRPRPSEGLLHVIMLLSHPTRCGLRA